MTSDLDSRFCAAELVHLPTLPQDSSLVRALDTDEGERLCTMRNALRRRQFLGGHWLARHLACARFGASPADWKWRLGNTGQPSLHLERHALHVSVSHSGEWLACAISSEPVGIDVEVPTRERDWGSLAEFAFPAEPDWDELSLSERKLKFINWWCMHEARGKRDGRGVQINVMRKLRLLPCASSTSDASSWPLSGGFLAIAGPRCVTLSGCSDRRSAWRFEDVAKEMIGMIGMTG